MALKDFHYPIRHLPYDLVAGTVVFLVAMPLCLGAALASGAPLLSGAIAGIIGGVVVGAFSASSVSVSGPSVGMVVVVLSAVTELGDFRAFLLALFLSGAFQIIIGVLRAGFIADYVPSTVIQGLLCAIGIIIVLKQLPFALTYTSENQALMAAFREASEAFSLAPLKAIKAHLNLGAIMISSFSLCLLILCDHARFAFFKKLPAPLLVVILGVLINLLFVSFWPALAQEGNELASVPVFSSINGFLSQQPFPAWHAWKNFAIYAYALLLAIVASLESLLNLEAIEKLDPSQKYCSRNRELVAQGIGNAFSGLVGGLPITSVIIRSSVNLQAGSKSKLSTILHGALILIVIAFFPGAVNAVPLASLATILIYVGIKLARPAAFTAMYHQGMSRFVPFLITICAIVFTNILTGVLVGLFFSFFFILRDNSLIQLDIINEKYPFGIVQRLVLPQHVSFLQKASLLAELDTILSGTHLIIDARQAKYIDQDVIEVIETFRANQAPSKSIALNLIGFKAHYERHDHIEFLNVTTYDAQSQLQPQDVLNLLQEGNKRFIEGKPIHRSLLDDIKATATMQHPVAIVLGCIDSRVPIETIFDMGVGDVFVVRVAGNIVNDDVLASMEFACHVSGAKMILVLGHTYCGAIKAACEGHESGHLTQLLHKIQPAVSIVAQKYGKETNIGPQFLREVTELNIKQMMQKICMESATLKKMVSAKTVALMGAIYDVETGKVMFDAQFYDVKQGN